MAREMKDSGIAWIGEIPNNWICGKCKMILSANDGGVWGNDPSGSENDKIVIRSTEQTMDGKWCIEAPARRDLTRIDYSKAKIEINDLLITKSSGSDLHIGKTTIADDYFNNHECYYSNFIQRIRCHDYNPKLLWYLFNSPIVREQCVFLQNTTSGIGNINAAIIDNLLIPIPPLNEQQSIIMILDKECARIDAVIERTRASIEEYKKLKQAVITQAVTKGIRPNCPMKDSGVDWIGRVSCDWTIQKLKNIIIAIESGVSVNAAQYPAQEGEIGVLKTSCVSKFNFLPEENKAVNQEEYDRVACPVKANTIIMSRMNTPDLVGACGYVSEDYPKLYLPDRLWQVHFSAQANVKYIWYYLNCRNVRNYYASLAVGTSSSMQNISQDQFYNTFVPIPTAEEQKEIVAYLDEKIPEIDALIDKKEKLISELESYKKSMIHEYVTGKKIVNG